MTTHRIVLHPMRPQPGHLDRPTLVARLHEMGLIEEPSGDQRFMAGPRFMELLVFVGCSPYVRLRPGTGGDARSWDFSHIQIPMAVEPPRLLSGLNTRAPRCPRCRREVTDWQRRLHPAAEASPEPRWHCPDCGTATPCHALDWRHSACLSGFPISIWQVHEGEAVPSAELLELLQAGCAGDWDYCYLREPAQE